MIDPPVPLMLSHRTHCKVLAMHIIETTPCLERPIAPTALAWGLILIAVAVGALWGTI